MSETDRISDRPLRFCLITTFYPPYSFGGDGIFVRQLANELASRGHTVDVIHCIDAYRFLAKDKPKAVLDPDPGVTVHALETPLGFLSPLVTQQTGAPFFKSSRIRQILAKGFDVIHFHNASLVGGPKLLEYGQAIKLYTMHEYWLICPTHMLLKFNREPCAERQCFICTLAHKRPPQWWRYTDLMQAAVKHIDVFIAPSRFSKTLHEEELDIPAVYLPNFVPLEPALPAADSVMTRQAYFLFVGRLQKLKGLHTLIPLFRRYEKAQLWIAGEGDYEPELRKLAEGNPNVQFLGYKSGRDLQRLYRNAIAVVVPSLFYEVFPLVTIEAFRQKTPVIVRNLGGLPEIVTESGGGFVYDSDEELESAMDKLITDRSMQSELGLRGYDAYIRHWSPDAHLARYFGLIDKIASDRIRAGAAT